MTIDGWNTKILDIGEGEPMLFVPIVQHLEVFESKLIQHFAKTHRVIFFRRRETTTTDLGVQDRAMDIKRVLDHLGLENVHLVAHSSRAVASLYFLIGHPEYVRSFVLMCLSPRVTIPKLDAFLADYFFRYVPLPRKVVLALLTSWLADKGTTEYKLIYDQWDKFRDIQKIWNHSIWTMARYDSRPYLPQVRTPVPLINSDDDHVNTVQAMRYFDDHLPNSYALKVVRGGKHFFQYWEAEQVIDYVERFYRELAATREEPARPSRDETTGADA